MHDGYYHGHRRLKHSAHGDSLHPQWRPSSDLMPQVCVCSNACADFALPFSGNKLKNMVKHGWRWSQVFIRGCYCLMWFLILKKRPLSLTVLVQRWTLKQTNKVYIICMNDGCPLRFSWLKPPKDAVLGAVPLLVNRIWLWKKHQPRLWNSQSLKSSHCSFLCHYHVKYHITYYCH